MCLVGGVNNTLHILLQNTLSSYIIYLFSILLLLLTTTIYIIIRRSTRSNEQTATLGVVSKWSLSRFVLERVYSFVCVCVFVCVRVFLCVILCVRANIAPFP